MTTVIVTPPGSEPVSLEEAKEHCQIDAGITDFDDLIEVFIKAATRSFEETCGYFLVSQTWRETADGFSCPVILTKRPRGAAALVVKYYDADNVQQTLGTGYYTEFAGVVSFAGELPSLHGRRDAVWIDYDVGVASDNVPADIKTALLLQIGFFFGARESQTEKEWKPTGAYEALIFPYRRMFV